MSLILTRLLCNHSTTSVTDLSQVIQMEICSISVFPPIIWEHGIRKMWGPYWKPFQPFQRFPVICGIQPSIQFLLLIFPAVFTLLERQKCLSVGQVLCDGIDHLCRNGNLTVKHTGWHQYLHGSVWYHIASLNSWASLDTLIHQHPNILLARSPLVC